MEGLERFLSRFRRYTPNSVAVITVISLGYVVVHLLYPAASGGLSSGSPDRYFKALDQSGPAGTAAVHGLLTSCMLVILATGLCSLLTGLLWWLYGSLAPDTDLAFQLGLTMVTVVVRLTFTAVVVAAVIQMIANAAAGHDLAAIGWLGSLLLMALVAWLETGGDDALTNGFGV